MVSNYYIYCISAEKVSTSESLTGFDGREISLVPCIDIYAVVSPTDRAHYDPALENLECHENVINHFLSITTVLPLRFSTIVKSLDDVKRMLTKYFPQFKENIERVKGKMEMGIKIFCNISLAVQDEAQTGLSGREYFLNKYNRYVEAKNKLEPYLNLTGEIHKSLSALSAENCCTNPLKNNLIMNSSYLVHHENMEQFKKAAECFKDKYSNFKVIVSGPWPPYHFVKVEEGEQ